METPRQEMEHAVHICCRQALRTTNATAQRDRLSTIQLWRATYSRRSTSLDRKLLLWERERHVSSVVQVKLKIGGAVWAKRRLYFILKVKKKMVDWAIIAFLINFFI